ncbi:glycosyltransferase [Paenibacillus thermotolerans]|uniref:glycosyltransferase n=1 Tax=Paenibacillus thermotolerans TaxID=3027807 RepID=UPI0023674557|nr:MULTISPECIES: glycosyltransferase [unclassified Paenibacillus]
MFKGDELQMRNGNKSSNQHLDDVLLEIDELIKKDLIDVAYQKYVELSDTMENEQLETDPKTKADFYASFAYFLFGVSEYESFFQMLIKAQDFGYSRDEIHNVLWEAFIEPNLDEFKTIYEENIEYLTSNRHLSFDHLAPFQALPFWLLPTETANEYYMYDKEQKLINEKISLSEFRNSNPLPTFDALADYLLLEDWNLNRILSYLDSIKKTDKKTYIVISHLGKFLSCLQGTRLNGIVLSNVLLFENMHGLIEYFRGSSAYLPRNVINLTEKNENIHSIISDIHNYRIRKQNRKGDRILLSICIPSFNRGIRAFNNITRLLQSFYDEELEVILCNNGTQNETKQYYEKIGSMEDARLKYFAFDENQGFAINCSKACELASGQFILLLSDEDSINFDVLSKIMDILNKSKESLSIVRTTSSYQSKPPVKNASRGRDALLTFMLSSNYMSGIIINNKLLKQAKGIEYVRDNLDKNGVCFWYPHMYWELLLCQYGNVLGTDLILITEGKAEKTDVDKVEIGDGDMVIPYYATVEGRLEQHEGFSSIFKDLEISNENNDLLREMYIKLCFKTLYLVALSINVFYKKTNVNVLDVLHRAYVFCSDEQRYKTKVNSLSKCYEHDVKIITQYYEHFKKQV